MKGKVKDFFFSYFDRETRVEIVLEGNQCDALEKLEGVDVEVVLKKHYRKRSLDANAYFWSLVDKLAEKLSVSKEDIYRSYVKHIGGNNEMVCVLAEGADRLCESWQKNGIGWITEVMPSKLQGCVNVVLYFGSSTYDTAQMSRLIDLCVQDCKQVGGIETMTPAELEALVERWDER